MAVIEPAPHHSKPRSKTVAAWLALLLGVFGVHRLYLHGPRDALAWIFPVPTLIGLVGIWRMRTLGVEDTTGFLLAPLFGLMVSVAMLSAIVYALMRDERFMQRYNPGLPVTAGRGTGVLAVLAAILALLLGGAALMATIAFSAQKFFEWQLASPQAAAGTPLQAIFTTA